MDFLLEILLELVLTPIMYLLVEAPISAYEDEIKKSKLTKHKKNLLIALVVLIFISIIACAIGGGVLLGTNESKGQFIGGIVLVSFAVVLFVGYFTFAGVCVCRHRKGENIKFAEPPDSSIIGKTVHVVIDRQLGSTHPEHNDIVYGVNYGFVPTAIGGDGEPQDAYILGVDEPVSEFDGVVVAIIHRLDDEEDKWVVAPQGVSLTDEEIREKTEFQEKFFQTELIRS